MTNIITKKFLLKKGVSVYDYYFKEFCKLYNYGYDVDVDDNHEISYFLLERDLVYQNMNLCRSAVRHKGSILSIVKNCFKTIEVCRYAVKQNVRAIKYVPEYILNDDELSNQLSEDLSNEEISELFPCFKDKHHKMLTYDNCIKAAISGEQNIAKYFPEYVFDANLLKIVLINDPPFLNTVLSNPFFKAQDYMFDSIYNAIKSNNDIFFYLPDDYKTLELCNSLVLSHGYMLEYIPEKLITEEMCISAVNDKMKNLIYIPQKFLTKEFFKKIKFIYFCKER